MSSASPTADSSADSFVKQMLHVMAKPIGPICNLDCEYCYYLHKEELYPSTNSWRMTADTLEEYIRQYIEAQPADAKEITFAWQGGEPTLLGLEFFQRIVELERQYARPGQKIVNALQTNGVLLDESWATFLHDNGFLVGLSIDGPAELHDRYRYDKKGDGTFHKVMAALKLLKQHEVEFNALVVVNRDNAEHGKRVYTYLRDNGIQFMQFIPIVEKRGVGTHPDDAAIESDLPEEQWDHLVSTRSVRPHQFGGFLNSIFDEWIRRDVGKVFVQIFDQALAAWLDLEPSLCVFRKECGRALAIEHNGDLYSCDHFVEPEFRLGNIHELPIVELAQSDQQRAFGKEKLTSLPQYCLDCEVRHACNGECPKNRFINTPYGDPGLNYLCAGYRAFFNHAAPFMVQMATELKAKRPASNVMLQFRSKKSEAVKEKSAGTSSLRSMRQPLSKVGRNDPCPCGSGHKFKKCCGKK